MEQIAENWKFCDDVGNKPLSDWHFTKATGVLYDFNLFFETQKGGVITFPANLYQAGITVVGNTEDIAVPFAKLSQNHINITHLQRLQYRSLTDPLEVTIQQDKNGFIARTPDIPLYGYGEDLIEAIEMPKREIESLYEDLIEDDNLSDEWVEIKEFLKRRIIDDI